MQDRFLIHLVSNGINTAHGVQTYIKVYQAGNLQSQLVNHHAVWGIFQFPADNEVLL